MKIDCVLRKHSESNDSKGKPQWCYLPLYPQFSRGDSWIAASGHGGHSFDLREYSQGETR